MGTSERKKNEVRQRESHLLDVAREMLVAQGYAGLSLERLADATNYSKGTIYIHFKTKEDLVTALASQTMEQRASLFDRACRFQGGSRERMLGIGFADELFARLYPQAFRSELIIKMADLEDRASDERKDVLRAQEKRCIGLTLRPIEEGVAAGDLSSSVVVPQIMIAVMTMCIGTHTAVTNFGPVLARIDGPEPFSMLRDNIQILLDGFGWKPLSSERDHAQTYRRIATEVFPHECESVGLS